MMSSAVASANSVGLLSGKIIGWSHHDAMAFTISLVNVFGAVEVPTRIVGLTAITAAVKLFSFSGLSNSERALANGFCSGVKSSISSKSNPCLSTI